MAETLNVSRLVRVSVNLSPVASARRGFGTLLIAGDSDVIDGGERIRTYTALEDVATDFGTSAPEYTAATLYFGQSPKPQTLMVGRWFRTAVGALLKGGTFTAAEQASAITTLEAISDGSFDIDIDGSEVNVTGCDFSSMTTLTAIAAEIDSNLSGATVTWDGERFRVVSDTTGESGSSVGYASAGASGTNISAILKLTTGVASTPLPGYDAETAVAGVTALADMSGAWYGLTFAASTMPDDDALVAVGAYIEAASTARLFGVTETDTAAYDSTSTTDLAYRFKALAYKRTMVQYSANAYAVTALFGRAFSVNFSANKSTITLMFKQEPGVTAENLTETQAVALKAKNCNVFVAYGNATNIVQYGTVASGAYIDEIHGLDWFSDALQTELYNLLYTAKTKVPQTDAGQNQLVAECAAVCDEAVNNGLVAPGTWNADGFGQLDRGDYLASGYYIYTAPMSEQAQSIREQRIAPPIQIALKLAGAIHEIDAIVDVNR